MKSAVLFLIFKREDTTKKVFERIRQAQPPKLYIAADGPRMDRADEIEKCQRTRMIVENVDWPCEVNRLYRDKNLGCGKGVSSAISWFFDHEQQGIIIEDDVLPHLDFFSYCDEMLERFKDDSRIQLISGFSGFYGGYHSDVPYYMSSHLEIWGWASWKRVWDSYVYDLNKIDAKEYEEKVKKRLPAENARFFLKIFYKMRNNPIDTWDYQLVANQFIHDRYTILTYINQVENLGFGSVDATHTIQENTILSNHHSQSIFPIQHPAQITVDEKADNILMREMGEFDYSRMHKFVRKLGSMLKRIL